MTNTSTPDEPVALIDADRLAAVEGVLDRSGAFLRAMGFGYVLNDLRAALSATAPDAGQVIDPPPPDLDDDAYEFVCRHVDDADGRCEVLADQFAEAIRAALAPITTAPDAGQRDAQVRAEALTEWGVRWHDVRGTSIPTGFVRTRDPGDWPYESESDARRDCPPGAHVVFRQRTTVADVVTAWARADREARP